MTRSTTARNGIIILLFTVLCVAGMEFLAVNMGQGTPFSSSYTVHAVFSDADGVPTAADVRASGVDVGKVIAVSHDPEYPGETVVTMEITNPNATPVYSDGYAIVRPKTLLGEKYIDLTRGDPATADSIPSGGYLAPSQANKDVSNDEIFNAFDARTRAEQQQVLSELDTATFQRAGDIQAILPQVEQVVTNLQPIAAVYQKDQPQVDDIFVQLDTIMQTVASEHQQLGGLLNAGSVALGAIGSRDQDLIATLQEGANFTTELENAMAPTVAQQRQAIAAIGPALQSQSRLLDLVVGPQPTCGGKPCGIDQLFTGTLLGSINYPNNQLTVTTPPGELVADEWDALFSQPTNDNRSLSYAPSLHAGAPFP